VLLKYISEFRQYVYSLHVNGDHSWHFRRCKFSHSESAAETMYTPWLPVSLSQMLPHNLSAQLNMPQMLPIDAPGQQKYVASFLHRHRLPPPWLPMHRRFQAYQQVCRQARPNDVDHLQHHTATDALRLRLSPPCPSGELSHRPILGTLPSALPRRLRCCFHRHFYGHRQQVSIHRECRAAERTRSHLA
jgi:hypothetical protein